MSYCVLANVDMQPQWWHSRVRTMATNQQRRPMSRGAARRKNRLAAMQTSTLLRRRASCSKTPERRPLDVHWNTAAIELCFNFNSWPTFSLYLYNRVWSELTCRNSLSHSCLACSRLSAHIQPSMNNPDTNGAAKLLNTTRPYNYNGHELS